MSGTDPQSVTKVGFPAQQAQTVQGSPAGTPLPVAAGTVASATTSRVAASASTVQLLAANTARVFFVVVNESTSATLYVKYGTTAALTDYTIPLAPGAWFSDTLYRGRIDGIWSSASGAAQLTEG